MSAERPLLGKEIALLVETEYIYEEVEYYKQRVCELGGRLTILAYLWGKPSIELVNDIDSPNRPITDAHRLIVTECVTRHDPNEFDVVICAANYVAVRLREVPPVGSLATPELTRSAPAVDFFARAMANKHVVKAAMCHALWILTPRPELLKGRRVICHTVVLADIHNAGAIYVPAPTHVVVDRDLVTGRSISDLKPYFDAIVETALDPPRFERPCLSDAKILSETAAELARAVEMRFAEAARNYQLNNRPVAKAAELLLSDTLDVSAEVRRFTGVDFDRAAPKGHKPILVVGSKFGTWSSEVTLVVSVLLKAGYRVQLATEDGSPPHWLSPSLTPEFIDGAWRGSVVSPQEKELALKFLSPGTREHALCQTGVVLDLRALARPPQVGDFLNNRQTLQQYREALPKSLELAGQFDAIIVAGGSGAIPGWMAHRGLHALILAFNNLGKPIMGECNGGLAIAQTLDPNTGRSILEGKAVTTHSLLDEYQDNWGWTAAYSVDPDSFWADGRFDLGSYAAKESWVTPGLTGNPLIDCESLFRNAAGDSGEFFSPAGTPYAVVVDENIITCRTTPDGYPGVLALLAVMDGRPALRGRLFIDQDERGRPGAHRREMDTPLNWAGASAVDAARTGEAAIVARWLESGGDPDTTDAEGWTPLLIAAAHGHAAIVDLLLWHDIPGARRANPDLRFEAADALPIYMAGQSGDIATVKSLLRARPGHLFEVAAVNGHTVLLQAAFYGQRAHQQLAQYLLENVGDILSIDSSDEATLESVRVRLLTATNARGQNPMAVAKAYGIRPMMEIFSRYPCPADTISRAYYTRLLRRIRPPSPRSQREQQCQAATDELIGSIQSALDDAEQATAKHASDESLRHRLDRLDELLAGPNLDINRLGGPLQRTALITACTGADSNDQLRQLRESLVDRLLAHEADPLIHEVHAMGVNAIIRSAVWGHLRILERFAAKLPSDVFAEALNEKPAVNGFTALHDLVLRGLSAQGEKLQQYVEQIGWLVAHGSRCDMEDHAGRTQLAIAQAGAEDPAFADSAMAILRVLAPASH